MGVGSSYLVKVCARFRGYAFDDFHVSNDNLTSSFDLGQIGTLRPAPKENHEDQAVSPGRIETYGLGVRTGYLSAGYEAMGRPGQRRFSRHAVGRTHQYKNRDVVSSSAASSSGLSVWTTSLGSNQEESSDWTPIRSPSAAAKFGM